MKLQVFRYNSDTDHSNSVLLVDGKYECDGIEDEYREVKKKHETRIPDGIYNIDFRTEGGFHNRYSQKFGAWHKGMLAIYNAPDWKIITPKMEFQYVLIHIGNDDDSTSGCYCVGSAGANDQNWVGNSTGAYKGLYPKVRNALLRNECVTIEFKTLDKV